MKFFTRQLFLSLIITFAFAPATYAVDGCSSTSFKVATSINLDAPPASVAGGDFNGDGRMDLVVSLLNRSREIMILFGRGGSDGFGPPISFPVEGEARHVSVGDLNGDGKPDLVVTIDGFSDPIGGRFVILINDGTGKFSVQSTVLLPGGPSRTVLSDINTDGRLDIIAGLFNNTDQGLVAVLLGTGTGFFVHATQSPIATFSSNSAAVVVGDFNEDGNPDFAVPGRLVGVEIWVGFREDFLTVFGPGPTVVTGNSPLSLTVANFNADSHLDLLADNRVVLGTGTGSFSPPIAAPFAENSVSALAADLNNDTHIDVVTSEPRGIPIMLGNGTGNLVRGKSYIAGALFFGSSTALGDFNQDGKVDLASIKSNGIGILDGDGTGGFNEAYGYHTHAPVMRDMVGADFNNDGKQDFAIVGPSFGGVQNPDGSAVDVALGDGSGVFTRKSLTNFGAIRLTSVTAADFNSDGKVDLAVTNVVDGRISILLNDGTGGFPTDGSLVPSIPVGSLLSAIKAGDFNNDTKADLIAIVVNSNTYAVLLGNGNGSFTNIGGGPLQTGFHFLDDLDVGDFNGDSKLDLAIIRSGSNEVHTLQGDGTGHFSNYAVVPLAGTPVSVLVRDLNGDGKHDIAVSHSPLENFIIRRGVLTILISNGADGFNAATNYATDSPGMLGSGDFNSDNKPDLVVSSGAIIFGLNSTGINFLTNIGNGEFNAPVNVITANVSDLVLVADFNNDGKDDVAVSHTAANVGILLNNFTSAKPCLSINDVSVTETDTGTVNADFTVSLSAASSQTVRVNYFTTPSFLSTFGTDATKGLDFEHVADTLTFLPGETSKTISIVVKGDLLDELDQSFHVILTTPINAEISDGKGLGTIVDNDSPPTISINDTTVVEGTGFGAQNFAVFTLTLNAPSENQVSLDFSLTPGTASSNVDYLNVSNFAAFTPGTVTTTVAIPIVQDNIFEPDETFSNNLANPTNGTIADGLGLGTITNDDAQPAIGISAGSFRIEGAAGTSANQQFNVNLSNPSSQTITVSFATANGSATAGSDYVATSGTLTFNPGEASKTIQVQVTGDNVDELDENYTVNLTNPTNATISGAQADGMILDDDGPTLSIGSASVTEGNSGFVNAVFTVTLSAASAQDIFVNYATTDGTATSNIDFQRVFSSTLFIPAGSTSATLNVRVFGDFQIEPDEQFTVTLQNPINATITVAQGTGTIVNDDSAGKLQFSSATFAATEDVGSAVITVNRLDGASGIVTVNFATSNGTATAGSDYITTTGTLTFLQGETSKTVSIPIINDNVLESGETVNLTLSNPSGATLGTPATATLTINTPLLLLILEPAGPLAQQAAALDSLLLMRDPFPVIQAIDFLNPGPDRNTRVILFVANLQLAPNDVASIVKVNLFDSIGQSNEVDAEDVRLASVPDFHQVTFRLPDNLRLGVVVLKVKSRDQESNVGTIRIR